MSTCPEQPATPGGSAEHDHAHGTGHRRRAVLAGGLAASATAALGMLAADGATAGTGTIVRGVTRRAVRPLHATTATPSTAAAAPAPVAPTAKAAATPTTTRAAAPKSSIAPQGGARSLEATQEARDRVERGVSRLPAKDPNSIAAIAAAAAPAPVGPVDLSDPVRNMLRKATWGVRPADLARAGQLGVDAWINEQLNPNLQDPEGDKAWATFPLAGANSAAVTAGSAMYSWDGMLQTIYGSMARQIWSNRQVYEIVVDVLANLLNVPMPTEVWRTGGDYHLQVIRKHAFGRYEDMLLAAMKHPGMLHYLNNDESTRKHVNENLGRELLELHTVGREAGYTEEEVKSSARILSGRTLDWRTDIYRYEADRHWVGPVKVLGFSHANGSAADGLAVGDAYLRYLATHPATAKRVATKLAQRFVSDAPPAALVERMTDAYLANGTEIRPVLLTMFRSPEFWASAGQKVRRPHEDMIATCRILDVKGADIGSAMPALYWQMWGFGQPPLGWPAPNGYPDVSAAWLSAGSVLARWNTHRKLCYVWFKGLSSPRPDLMVADVDKLTVAQFTDEMCLRFTGQLFSARDRAAVMGAAEIGPNVPMSWHKWQVTNAIVPLILDSIYFQVR